MTKTSLNVTFGEATTTNVRYGVPSSQKTSLYSYKTTCYVLCGEDAGNDMS